MFDDFKSKLQERLERNAVKVSGMKWVMPDIKRGNTSNYQSRTHTATHNLQLDELESSLKLEIKKKIEERISEIEINIKRLKSRVDFRATEKLIIQVRELEAMKSELKWLLSSLGLNDEVKS